MITDLIAVLSGVHVIGEGEGAWLRFAAPRKADKAMRLGTYEPAIQQCITIHLAPGDVFVDIGANIGFFTLIGARRVGPRGRVYSFEPVAENAASIVRSSHMNGFSTIEVFAEAMGARTERSELLLAHHIGGAMLASAGTPPDHCGSVNVNVVSLDDAIDTRKLRPPALIKIDVEGAELEVLQGMRRTLQSVRPTVIYEVDDETRRGLDGKCQKIADFLHAAGYGLCPLPASYDDANWHVEHILARAAKPGVYD
jgi:FkbM family methyltransferase